jgi:2-methylisocitrate lyase-like PEP mutase family enzyme
LRFADALASKEDIAKVARSVKKPLSVNMGLGIRARKTTPLIPPKELEKLGVAQISYPRLLSAAALKGMLNALDVFKSEVVAQNKSVDRPDLSVTFEELNDLMGMKVLDELERRYT